MNLHLGNGRHWTRCGMPRINVCCTDDRDLFAGVKAGTLSACDWSGPNEVCGLCEDHERLCVEMSAVRADMSYRRLAEEIERSERDGLDRLDECWCGYTLQAPPTSAFSRCICLEIAQEQLDEALKQGDENSAEYWRKRRDAFAARAST